jgi:hypothetical protein
LLFAFCCLLFAVCCLLFAVCCLPRAVVVMRRDGIPDGGAMNEKVFVSVHV